MSLLVVTAVEQERDAVLRGGDCDVIVAGVGPVAAGVATARALAERSDVSHVVSAGIAGGFTGRAAVGDVVVGTAALAADLGCRTDEGFLTLQDMGLGQPTRLDYADAEAWCRLLGDGGVAAATGEIVTLSCMTGTDIEAKQLSERYPAARAEAMEGFGVAWAAYEFGLPCSEVRAISNHVGKRDTSGWDIAGAFEALSRAFAALLAEQVS